VEHFHVTDPPFDDRRDAIVEFLREKFQPENGGNTLQNLHSLQVRMVKLGFNRVVPALQELLEEPNSFTRVFAAWWMLMLRQSPLSKVRVDQASRAFATFSRALVEGDRDERLWPLILLGTGAGESCPGIAISSDVHEILLVLIGDSDECLRITAAAAILRSEFEEGTIDAITVLVRGLESETPTLALLSAGAFGQARIRWKLVVPQLVRMLSELEPALRLPTLLALKSMGSYADTAIEPLIELFENEAVEVAIRSSCIGALGSICGKEVPGETRRKERGRGKVKAILARALGSAHWPIVWSALIASIEIGEHWPNSETLFLNRLEHADASERLQAATAISSDETISGIAVPVLMRLLVTESSEEVRHALVRALVSAGLTAVPALVAEVRENRAHTLLYVAEALIHIGSKAVPQVAQMLLGDGDERVRDLTVGILNRIGPKASAAVPIASELLCDPRPEIREHAAKALAMVGPAAGGAIPVLIVALSDSRLDIAHWAQQALFRIGPSSVPGLRSALPGMAAAGRPYAEQLLAHFAGPGLGPTTDGFEWVRDDDGLVLFAWICHSLLREPNSIRGLAIRLGRLAATGKWRDAPVVGEGTIRARLKALMGKINKGMKANIKIVQKADGKLSTLSEGAKPLLERVTVYLQKIGRFVEPGREG
jgi:HEAT repeat protein